MSIFVTGDTHSDFSRLTDPTFSAWPAPPEEGDYLLITGDFGGVWDDSERERNALDRLSRQPFTTLWVDGNHENYDLLEQYPAVDWRGGRVQFIRPNIIHLLRGFVYEIEGLRFFAMGGASSHDISDGILEVDDPGFAKKFRRLQKRRAHFRINHFSWWETELPDEADFDRARENLAACGNKVDVIVTHCAPTSVQKELGIEDSDRLTDFLDEVRENTDFSLWLFGHYHANGILDRKYALLYGAIMQIKGAEK